ncbi:hypothetical protein OKW20_000874 [Ensifer sp. LBL]
MTKKPQKKFTHMLSSHVRGGGKKPKAPRASIAEMKAIEWKDERDTKKSRTLWTEYTLLARPVPGGAPGLRSQKKKWRFNLYPLLRAQVETSGEPGGLSKPSLSIILCG